LFHRSHCLSAWWVSVNILPVVWLTPSNIHVSCPL
jgi:hypothetical protein